MSQRIIVAYDTRNGSTAEIAEAITSQLRENGFEVEIFRAGKLRRLRGVDALVVGAPIYSGRWLRGAHRLLKRVKKLSPEARPPVAIFALGPRKDTGPEDWIKPREQFERALRKHPSITPVSTALFGGADPPGKRPRRDIRDWNEIRAWTEEVARLFVGGDPGNHTEQAGSSD